MKLGIGSILLGIVVVTLITLASIYNGYVDLEEGIVASDRSRQTTLNNLSQKVKEVIGVREMAVEDIRKTVVEQIRARAGDGGYKAYVLLMQENNIAPSQEIYTKIITIIDVGRNQFEAAERLLIDRKRVACSRVRQLPHKWILPLTGLPTLKIGCAGGQDDYPVILSESTAETFRTGVDKGLY